MNFLPTDLKLLVRATENYKSLTCMPHFRGQAGLGDFGCSKGQSSVLDLESSVARQTSLQSEDAESASSRKFALDGASANLSSDSAIPIAQVLILLEANK